MILKDIDYDKVTLSIYDAAGHKVGELYSPHSDAEGYARDIKIQHDSNGWKELSFTVDVNVNGEANPLIDKLVNEYLIYVDDGTYQDVFIISEPNLSHSKGSMSIAATCPHRSMRLRTKKLYLVFDDENGIGTCGTLAGIILQGTGWTLGRVDTFYEADGTTEKIRSLKSSGKDGAYQLMSKLCELFNCKPVYHGMTKTVDLVAFAPYVYMPNGDKPLLEEPDKLFELNYSKAMSGISRVLDTSDLITRLYVEGEYGDDGYLGIESANPTGMNFIMNFDYLKKVGLFTDDHQAIVDQYLTDIASAKEAAKQSSINISTIETELMQIWGTADYALYTVSEKLTDKMLSVLFYASLDGKATINVGDSARVAYTDGTQLETKIAAVNGSTVTIEDAVDTTRVVRDLLVYRKLASGQLGGKEAAREAAQEAYASMMGRVGDNLIAASDKLKTSTSPLAGQYSLTEDWKVGQKYTLSVWGRLNEGQTFLAYRDTEGTALPVSVYDQRRRCWITTFTCPASASADKRALVIYNSPAASAATSTISRIKLEYGESPTAWSAAEDSSQKPEVIQSLEKIELLYNGDGTAMGIYGLTERAIELVKQLRTANDDFSAKTNNINNIEVAFSEAMGDLLRDGYWQDSNYVTGQEHQLYNDAVDALSVMSRPVVTYNISIFNYVGTSGENILQAPVNSPVHIIDVDASIDEWGYVEQAVYVLDSPYKNTIKVATKEAKFAGQSFTQVLSQIAETANEVRSMRDVYKRAAIISSAGQLSTKTLQGIIDVEATRLLSSASNWYTDERGNIIMLSQDGLSAMMLCGEGFLIADGKTPSGEWNWRTAGSGHGLSADEVNTGTLNAGLIKILGTDQFYWDADNIYVKDPSDVNRQIRIGLYDGQHYGIGITTDDGATWRSALDFDGLNLRFSTIPASQVTDLQSAIVDNLPTTATQYYLSTSPDSLVGGEWVDTPPTWVDGTYYWTRQVTTYSDGTPTSYTPPVRITGSSGASGESVYKVEIISSNGGIFKNGIIDTVLRAVVYYGDEDVTDTIDANRFHWTRVSDDTAGDEAWNNAHFGGTKQIVVTPEDVQYKATFFCEILKD